MKKHIALSIFAIVGLAAIRDASADCTADATVQQTTQRFANAQKLERQGDMAGAFAAYVAAQAYTCQANPVELQSAQHAAPLALTLGTVAEKRGEFEKAFHLYNDGGQYAAADRALMSWVRANPDSPSTFTTARDAFGYRSLPAFAANNKVRLAVTGAYHPDPQNIAEVLAMPAKGAERAFQKETAAFNEQYLKGYVQQIQSRPDGSADIAAMQSWAASQQAFLQKWSTSSGESPLKTSLAALDLVQRWSSVTNDDELATRLASQRNQRLQQRTDTLTKSYAGAPELLESAIDYAMAVQTDDDAARQARVSIIHRQAVQLADAAVNARRQQLASEYYEVAGETDKAQAARDAQQQAAMNSMQPQIEQMRQQALQMQQQFSDPAAIQAMREQALAIQKALQQAQSGAQ